MERFPEIEPFEQGMLEVGDGQRVYWEVSGNPDGRPALAVHGGPGSGSAPGRRRLFDPGAYLIIQFDHHAWLADGQLLRDAGRLAGLPGCTWSPPATPAAGR